MLDVCVWYAIVDKLLFWSHPHAVFNEGHHFPLLSKHKLIGRQWKEPKRLNNIGIFSFSIHGDEEVSVYLEFILPILLDIFHTSCSSRLFTITLSTLVFLPASYSSRTLTYTYTSGSPTHQVTYTYDSPILQVHLYWMLSLHLEKFSSYLWYI